MLSPKTDKFCRGCNRDLNLSCFHKNSQHKDGLSARCKDCVKAYRKQYYEQNSEKAKADSLAYYYTNKEEVILKSKTYYANNKNQFSVKRRKYREKHREAILAGKKRHRYENPEKYASWSNDIRARKRGVFDVDISKVFVACTGICQLCFEPVNAELKYPHELSKSLDHIIPISKGGRHNYSNIQLAHLICNMRKNNHHYTMKSDEATS